MDRNIHVEENYVVAKNNNNLYNIIFRKMMTPPVSVFVTLVLVKKSIYLKLKLICYSYIL